MSNSKDKRTKEEILKLLDRAIEQEERLSEKIKSLEVELADCRKKADDPRHELTEEALSASKVSFRIDYYRTAKKSPLKGIIEHLPSRQNKAFEGEGKEVVRQFISRFLNEETSSESRKKTAASDKNEQESLVPVNTDIQAVGTELSEERTPVMPFEMEEHSPVGSIRTDQVDEVEVTVPEQSSNTAALAEEATSGHIPANEAAKTRLQNVMAMAEEEQMHSGSRLLQKLKVKLADQSLSSNAPVQANEINARVTTSPATMEQTEKSPQVQRALAKVAALSPVREQKVEKQATSPVFAREEKITPSTQGSHLMQRLREKYRHELVI